LVDDDMLVRVGLRMMLDGPKTGWEIIGEAANGFQALDMIESLRPDLLIMDMKMPQMDGSELLKILRQRDRKLKIVVLSCYDDYAYMREAMTNGANEYILKPELTKELLVDVLGRLEQQMKEEEKRDKEYYDLKKQAAFNAYIAQETLYRNILKGKYTTSDELNSAAQQNGINGFDPCMFVVIFSAVASNPDEYIDATKREALDNSLYNIIQGLLQKLSASPLIRGEHNGNYSVILGGAEEHQLLSDIESMAKRAIQAASIYIQMDLTVSVSCVNHNVVELFQEYRHAEDALKQRILFGGKRIYYSSKLPIDAGNMREDMTMLYDHIQNLFTSLEEEKDVLGKQQLIGMLDWVRGKGSMKLLRAFCNELSGRYNKQVHLANMEGELREGLSYLNMDKMLECTHLHDLADLFMQHYRTLKVDVVPVNESNISPAIRKAIEYIRFHYHLPIGLTELSMHIGISKSHLSSVFREQTGLNFVEYMTCYRIEQAKRLLRADQLKINEIATKVGFESGKYFSQVFHSKIGVTPSDYKRSMLINT
jgi:two-component system response regulator YesN